MISKEGKVIVNDAKLCRSLFSKAAGLRFRGKPKDACFIFIFDKPQRVMMDMWFVFYPIDVIFLDKDKRVVEIKEKFLPWSFYSSKKEASYIIEFECGIVIKNKISIGNTLEF